MGGWGARAVIESSRIAQLAIPFQATPAGHRAIISSTSGRAVLLVPQTPSLFRLAIDFQFPTMTLPPSSEASPLAAERFSPSETDPSGRPSAPARDARWESFWKRITISVSLAVLGAVALFMLPKIDGRNSRLQVQADTRTELWRKELIASGKASPQPTPAAAADIWLLVGIIGGAGLVLGGLAYVAIGPRRDSERNAQRESQRNASSGTAGQALERSAAVRQTQT